jgi:hypothetical protein
MGYAARANPRSAEGKAERDALNARLDRFFEAFATRSDYEYYLQRAGVTPEEWTYLESRLPARLAPTVISPGYVSAD